MQRTKTLPIVRHSTIIPIQLDPIRKEQVHQEHNKIHHESYYCVTYTK